MTDHKRYTDANRIAWNEAAPYHKKNRPDDLHAIFAQPGASTLDEIVTPRLLELGLSGKRVAQICCNNGRELISLVNLGAAGGVGFDISDAFIAEANELRDIAGADCTFIRTDVLDIDPQDYPPFDLVYISIGALCWLPDLNAVFRIVRGLLQPGGHLVIYETHPFANMLAFPGEENFDPEHPANIAVPYFHDKPLEYCDGLDYYGMEEYDGSVKYEFLHTLGDILNAIAGNGMRLISFDEYEHDICNLLGHIEGVARPPLSYILVARAEQA